MDQSDFTTASDKVDAITTELDWSGQATEKTREIAEFVEMKPAASGRAPRVVAASAAYIAGLLVNEKQTQETIADAAGCHVHSIRQCYPDIARAIDGEGITAFSLENWYRTDDDCEHAESEPGPRFLDPVRRLLRG